jgi:hypothetical protein
MGLNMAWDGAVGFWGPRGAGEARPDFEQKIEIVSKRGNPWVRARRAESGRSQVSTPWRQGNSLIRNPLQTIAFATIDFYAGTV